MAPNYWSQTVTETHGTEIKRFSEILLQKATFDVLFFRYWLLSGDLFGDVRSVAVEYTTVVCSILDSMNDSPNITFHDFTVTGLV
jgi:hypothetical protein